MSDIPTPSPEDTRTRILRGTREWFAKAQQLVVSAAQSDERSRRNLYLAIGIGVLIARRAFANGYVWEAIVDVITEMTGKAPNPNKIDLNVSVAVQGATTPEMRAKAGKGGRAIAILRLLPLKTAEEVADYLEEQGGIERLLASNKQSVTLLPNELVITCEPELLNDVLSREGSELRLRVTVGERIGSERQPVVLIAIETEEEDDPFAPDAAEPDQAEDEQDGDDGEGATRPWPEADEEEV